MFAFSAPLLCLLAMTTASRLVSSIYAMASPLKCQIKFDLKTLQFILIKFQSKLYLKWPNYKKLTENVFHFERNEQ